MQHLTIPLSSVRLTTNEASGNTSISAGLRPARYHQAPQRSTLPPWHVAYAHPTAKPSGSHHPLPQHR